MIHFDRCSVLFQHLEFLEQQLRTKEVFFVWWCVRDLLLGIEQQPTDIDLTMGGSPDQIWSRMDEKWVSRFKTDKFGTITLIPHKNKKIQYEITPFRTEWGYADFRHPEQITRSNSLLADSARRDFTINCLYWYGTQLPKWRKASNTTKATSAPEFLQLLTTHKAVYVTTHQTLVLQDHTLINALFHEGKLQHTMLHELLASIHCIQLPGKKPSHSKLSIIIDAHQGINDLLERQLCAVGDPHQRFGEDALRIIRGPRFINVLNHKIQKLTDSESYFDFESTTRDAMKKNYYLVSYVAKERIRSEMEKVFKAADPFGFIALLDELHTLGILFPALTNCKQVEQPVRYHPFDVYNHTLLALYELQKLNKDWLVRLGMLYHDVGKPEQYHFYSLHILKDEKRLPIAWQMYHTNLWVELAHRDFGQLWFSKREIEEISRYIKWHHRPGELLDGKPENLPKKLRKMISEVGIKKVLNLIDISIADRLGMYNPVQPPVIDWLKHMKALAKKLYQEEGRFTMQELAINGDALMLEFELAPGPEVGMLIKKAFDWVLEDVQGRNNKKKILAYLHE